MRSLCWLPLSLLSTLNQAKVSYQVPYKGLSEKVLRAVLHVLDCSRYQLVLCKEARILSLFSF